MVISELGLVDNIELVESHPFDNNDDFLQVSPLGKVPCLEADGESIQDSEVICDFLDASFTGGELFNTIYADWRLKSLFSVCSGLMDSLVARRIEIVRAGDGTQSEFWLKRHTDAILRGLAAIESKLELLPDDFSILHINLLSCLAYLDFRHQDLDWRTEPAAIKAFYDEFSARPCFADNLLSDG